MFRRTVARKKRGCFHVSRPLRLFWGYKESDLHRLSRERPWWESAAIFAGLLVFINVSSAAMYFGNRLYQRWRPSGNDIYVNTIIDEKLFTRPDLAVAAIRMTLHHALADVKTPYGCPIVAPKHLEQEAHELVDLVRQLNTEQPVYSIPDLWAIVSTKALARIGGPNLLIKRGRDHVPDFLTKDDLLKIVAPVIAEDQRDVLGMKRLLVKQGLSVEHIVALVSSSRTVGFHERANIHTKRESKPRIRRHASVGPDIGNFAEEDTIEKCTLDPFVFSGDYCSLLLDYNWKHKGLFRKSTDYRCSQDDRRRQLTFIDPFSDSAATADRRVLEAKARAEAMSTGNLDVDSKSFGRSGEAQLIPGVKVTPTNEELKLSEESFNRWENEPTPERLDPCEHTSMMGIDVMLLDDALTRGWLHRFSSSELAYYAAVGEVYTAIQQRGHNANKLYEVGRIS